MTIKSPSGVFAVLVFSIRKQITVLFILCCILSLISDLFVLPHVCMLINLINSIGKINWLIYHKGSIHFWPITIFFHSISSVCVRIRFYCTQQVSMS